MTSKPIKEGAYNEREIAVIITGIANTQPDLVRFTSFNLEPMITLCKAHGGKRFLLTSWKRMVEVYALRNPVMFEVAAHHIRLRLSAHDPDDQKYWFGNGRINPTFPMSVNRDGEKELVAAPMECCMEIVIDPFYDRLKHLLEGEC
jgi:hypothetical protein